MYIYIYIYIYTYILDLINYKISLKYGKTLFDPIRKQKDVYEPKFSFPEMAHTNFFFSIRKTAYQQSICTKNIANKNFQKFKNNINLDISVFNLYLQFTHIFLYYPV